MAQSKKSGTLSSLGIIPAWAFSLTLAPVLVLILLVAANAPGDLATMARFAYAPTCQEGAASGDCQAELPGTTTARRDSTTGTPPQQGGSQTTALIYVAVPDAPEGTRLFQGDVVVQISSGAADRLGLSGAGHDVTVTLFNGEAVEIVGPNGESARHEDTPVARAAGMFGLGIALIVLAAFIAIYLARRVKQHGWSTTSGTGLRVELPRWLLPASVAVLAGAVLGAVLGGLAGTFVDLTWVLPVMFGVFAVVSMAIWLGWRRVRTT
ncbi:hypothetical protein [Phytoactinopolyspora mesophila]|uniref:Uncharacterized protein n=1 Tax=Phytoactinopolyspora mesophila TaxID=2650750 RepID=A0A7K3LXI8_9ACTN|nr:hypothetical protein [Phytoactinopolyspora mesophila]NDL55705.1 hypothetical protein [Phytoactinopolyspora mesophila]